MYMDQDGARVVSAFLECIADNGVTGMTVDHVARKLGSSRAGLYRQFGSWPQMIAFGYEAMLEWVDAQLPRPGEDRRGEFEKWWSDVTRLLGSPHGQGVLAMRSLAEVHLGPEELDDFERVRLRSLVRWCSSSRAAVRATWLMVRAAAGRRLASEERLELREIVWLVVGGERTTADASSAEALHAPLM